MRVLHAGAGGSAIIPHFDGWEEVRLDIDPAMKPDIVASLTDMGDIGTFDAIYTCHCLEHLYPHEVDVALREFRRVLAPDGYALILVPDLEDVPATDDILYDSPGGPVSGLDILYGHQCCVRDNLFMAHHTGFTKTTLDAALRRAGFEDVVVNRLEYFNLMAAARCRKDACANPTEERSHPGEDAARQPEHDFGGCKGFAIAAD